MPDTINQLIDLLDYIPKSVNLVAVSTVCATALTVTGIIHANTTATEGSKEGEASRSIRSELYR